MNAEEGQEIAILPGPAILEHIRSKRACYENTSAHQFRRTPEKSHAVLLLPGILRNSYGDIGGEDGPDLRFNLRINGRVRLLPNRTRRRGGGETAQRGKPDWLGGSLALP